MLVIRLKLKQKILLIAKTNSIATKNPAHQIISDAPIAINEAVAVQLPNGCEHYEY